MIWYRARAHGSTHGDRPSASPGFARDPAERASLIQRAGVLATLSHPNVTALFDVGDHEGRLYLVFEFLKGQSLRAEMAGRMMNVRRALELAVQIADAVSDAHSAGFIHGLEPRIDCDHRQGLRQDPLGSSWPVVPGFDPNAASIRLHDHDSPEEARARRPTNARISIPSAPFSTKCSPRGGRRTAAPRRRAHPIAHVPREVDEVVLKAVAPNPASRHQSAATLAAEREPLRRRSTRAEGPTMRRNTRSRRNTHRASADDRCPDSAQSCSPDLVGGVVRISTQSIEKAERASTSSIPAVRAALMTSVWTCET